MALVGDSVFLGLDVIRSKLGEGAYRFIMRFARKKEISPSTSKKLSAVGSLCGLNAQEIESASNGTSKNTKFPFWLRFVLLAAAFIATSSVILVVLAGNGNGLYLPGTLYASRRPNDFQNCLLDSSTLSHSATM